MNTEFFTKPAGNFLTRAWTNKQTSGAAIVYLSAKYGSRLGAVWFPNHAPQFAQTADILEGAAVGYGLIMAGDAKPTPPTSHLDEKPDPTKGA